MAAISVGCKGIEEIRVAGGSPMSSSLGKDGSREG